MRRIVLVAVLAWCAGFGAASMSAYAYTQMHTWRQFGERFQLGYIVGYLDAVKLSKRKDARAMIPSPSRGDYEGWRQDVNAFFEDPVNENRPVPDAMLAVGQKLRERIMKEYTAQRRRRLEAGRTLPSPSPEPE